MSVEADERGRPLRVFRERTQRCLRVANIQDRWRIDDGWWQRGVWGEVSRMYYALELQGGQLLTVYRDLLMGLWYEQTTAMPMNQAPPVDVLAPVRNSAQAEGKNDYSRNARG